MVKCESCGEKIGELFLGKIYGTHVRKGKKVLVYCSNCQRKLGDKILE